MDGRNATIAAAALVVVAGMESPVRSSDAFDAAFATHVAAVQARDLAALERTITSDDQLTLILPNGVRTGTRQAYLDFHKRFFASPTWTIRFDPVAKIVGPDFAVVTTKSLYQDDGGKIQTRSWVTFTFHKEAGAWRLIHDQNTRLPAGEP